LSFFEAALFQWINPKAWMMGLSAIATYTSVGTDMAPQVAIMVLVFFLFTWPCAGLWLFFGSGLKRLLSEPNHQRWFNWVMAVLLVLSMHEVAKDLWLAAFG
jgi:threonine/homoserine/homoserine lactone efflux protein